MSLWTVLSYAAWGISGVLLLWLIFDAIRVSQEYDEDFLLSSREGEE